MVVPSHGAAAPDGPEWVAVDGAPAVTIDALLAVVEWAESTLGVGTPLTGDQYWDIAQRLEMIAANLTQVATDAPWRGLAGALFDAEIQGLVGSVKLVGEIDEYVADVLDYQASAVEIAREWLWQIGAGLNTAREEFAALASSGNLVGAAAVEQVAVAYANNMYNQTVNQLHSFSVHHASLVSGCDLRLVEYFSGLPCVSIEDAAGWAAADGMAAGGMAAAAGLSPSSSAAVSVAPAVLTSVADSLRGCATALAEEIPRGEGILGEVRATHGQGGFAGEFDAALALYSASHGRSMWDLFVECDALALRLGSIARSYSECDADAADVLADQRAVR